MTFLLAVVADEGNGVKDTVNSIADTHDQIILALIAIVAASTGALVFVIRGTRYAREGAAQATAANSAVNNVGPGAHTLYNLTAAIKEDVDELKAKQDEFARHGWSALPDDLATAPALTSTIRKIQDHDELLDRKLDIILSELRDHVEWEMSQKYHPGAD